MGETKIDLGIPGLGELKVIGSGGSAVVYRALRSDPAGGPPSEVAIKVLKSSWDPNAIRRFEREQRAMRRLAGNPGFVPILETGTTAKGAPYFMMPFYTGGSLHEKISRTGPIEWPRALRLIEQVAETVDIAHRAEVFHRDLKPGNILLSADGVAHVTDFGISLITSESVDGFPTTSTAFTPAYSPPEAFTNSEKPSAASDVYGLAATLWALLAGHAPFKAPGEQAAPATVFGRVAMQQVGDLRERGIPSPICRFIEESMAKEPSDRPENITEFLRRLRMAREDAFRGVDAPRLELRTAAPVTASVASIGVDAGRPDDNGLSPVSALAQRPELGGPDVGGTSPEESTAPFTVVMRAEDRVADERGRSNGSGQHDQVLPAAGPVFTGPAEKTTATTAPFAPPAPVPLPVSPSASVGVDAVTGPVDEPSALDRRTAWPWPALLATLAVVAAGLLMWSRLTAEESVQVDTNLTTPTSIEVSGGQAGESGNRDGSGLSVGTGDPIGDPAPVSTTEADGAPVSTADLAAPSTGSAPTTATSAGVTSSTVPGTTTSITTDTSTSSSAPTATTASSTTVPSTASTASAPSSTQDEAVPIRIVSGPTVVQAGVDLVVFAYQTNDVCGTGSFVFVDTATGEEAGRWTGDQGCFGPRHEGRTSWSTFDLRSGGVYAVSVWVDGQPAANGMPAGSGRDTATLTITLP